MRGLTGDFVGAGIAIVATAVTAAAAEGVVTSVVDVGAMDAGVLRVPESPRSLSGTGSWFFVN